MNKLFFRRKLESGKDCWKIKRLRKNEKEVWAWKR